MLLFIGTRFLQSIEGVVIHVPNLSLFARLPFGSGRAEKMQCAGGEGDRRRVEDKNGRELEVNVRALGLEEACPLVPNVSQWRTGWSSKKRPEDKAEANCYNTMRARTAKTRK